MKAIRITLCMLALSGSILAQVPKQILVEHFTNTKCSICSSKNPTFYANLKNNHPTVFHLSFHPSSPYTDCVLNNFNPSENDQRANFYSVYGATPRVVINGDAISSSADLSKASLISPYTGMTSPVSISVKDLHKPGNDTIFIEVTYKVESLDADSGQLIVFLVEDTVFYNAPNGENVHPNVFRKYMSPPEGIRIVLPPTVGWTNSLQFAKIYKEWNNRMYPIAILQYGSSKEIIQVARSFNPLTGINNEAEEIKISLTIYPNPANEYVTVKSKEEIKGIFIYNACGQAVLSNNNDQSAEVSLDVSELLDGLYYVSVLTSSGRQSRRILIRR